MDKYTKQEMVKFDADIGKYTPDAEIWNALAVCEEYETETLIGRGEDWLNGLYRGILVGQNGAWSKKAKHALWEELQKFQTLAMGGEAKVTEWRIKDTQRQIEDSKKRIASYKQEVEKLGWELKKLKAKQ